MTEYIIYKIQHTETGKCYIGSTKELEQRMRCHKTPSNQCYSKFILEPGKILTEIIEVCSNDNFSAREAYYIRLNQSTNRSVNRNVPTSIKAANIKEYQQKYHELYREKINQYAKEHYAENKERMLKKVKCECGGSYCYVSRCAHFRTKRHQKHEEEKRKGPMDQLFEESKKEYKQKTGNV